MILSRAAIPPGSGSGFHVAVGWSSPPSGSAGVLAGQPPSAQVRAAARPNHAVRGGEGISTSRAGMDRGSRATTRIAPLVGILALMLRLRRWLLLLRLRLRLRLRLWRWQLLLRPAPKLGAQLHLHGAARVIVTLLSRPARPSVEAGAAAGAAPAGCAAGTGQLRLKMDSMIMYKLVGS